MAVRVAESESGHQTVQAPRYRPPLLLLRKGNPDDAQSLSPYVQSRTPAGAAPPGQVGAVAPRSG